MGSSMKKRPKGLKNGLVETWGFEPQGTVFDYIAINANSCLVQPESGP